MAQTIRIPVTGTPQQRYFFLLWKLSLCSLTDTMPTWMTIRIPGQYTGVK